MHFLQILKQLVYAANNMLEGATAMFPFQNNHSPLNLLYMYTSIKQSILYNKHKHCYTDRPSLLNKRSSMLDETFMFYSSHQACIYQHRISKILNLCSLLPMCMVAMAFKMMCTMQHNFWLEFI